MLHQITEYDAQWQKKHRRSTDEPSILKQVVEMVVMFGLLVMILVLLW